MSLDTILSISTSIVQMAQNVKANKDRCLRVARRVKALEQLVMAIKNKGPGFGSMTVNNALVDLCITLEEAKKIMEKYSKTKGMMGFLKSSSIEDKFSGVNERLSDSFQILSGALQIEQNHKLCRLFDPVSEESIYENEDDGWLQPTVQMSHYPQLSSQRGSTLPPTPMSSPTPQMSPYPQVSNPIAPMPPYPQVSNPISQMPPYPQVSNPTTQMSPYSPVSSPTTQMSPYSPVSSPTTQMSPYSPVSSPTTQMSPYSPVSSPTTQISPYSPVSSPTTQMSPYPPVSSPTTQMSPYSPVSNPMFPVTPGSSPVPQTSPYGPVSGQTGPWHFTMPMSPPATPSLTSPSTIVYNTCTQVSTYLSKKDLSKIPFQGTATPTSLSKLPSSGQSTPTSVTYYMVKR